MRNRLVYWTKHLTLFDFGVIAVAVLAVVFFAYIFFRQSTYVTITVKVGADSVYWEGAKAPSWFARLFYVGMSERDGFGRAAAEVLNIRSYDLYPNQKVVYATMKLKAVYNRASNQYFYKGKPVLVGSTIRLYLDRLLVDGLITHIENVKDQRQKQILLVEAQVREETPAFPETSGTKSYIADAIAVGEEIKDDQGNTVIKVLDKRVEDAKRLVTTSNGNVIIQTNPLRKDVSYTLEVAAIKLYDRYYVFDDVPVLVGIGLPLNTPVISVWPEITLITPVGEK